MRALLLFGSEIKPTEGVLAAQLAAEPPIFTEDRYNPEDEFVDPSCRVLSVFSKGKMQWLVVAAETIHEITPEDAQLRFDPLLLHKTVQDQKPVRRVQIFCQLAGLKTFSWPQWWLCLSN